MNFCTFESKFDTKPKARSADWGEVCQTLRAHKPVRSKELVKLWSPARYMDGASRGLEGVAEVTMAVFDFDDGHEPEDFFDLWDGLEFVAHSTFSSTPDKPKWRAIFPLLAPVPAAEWPAVVRKLRAALTADVSDPSCTDASRMFYIPSCPIGGESFAWAVARSGELLDPSIFDDVSEEPGTDPVLLPSTGDVPVSSAPSVDTRPGEAFEQEASWDDILPRHGWQRCGKSWKGQTVWTRPGKKRGEISAKTGDGPYGDRMYVFSSSTTLPCRRALTKFSVYALLDHGGDFAAAARSLKAKGYGSTSVSANGSAPPRGPGQDFDKQTGGQKRFALSDLGNAERMIDRHGDDLRYCALWGAWLVWNGRYWEKDENGGAGAVQAAIETVRSMQLEAVELVGSEREALGKWSFSCESSSRINNMLGLAKSLKGVPITPSDIDSHDHLICCENGTFNLLTGQLEEHRREDLITRMVPAKYSPEADCPLWVEFLERIIPDPSILRYIWKAVGYSLWGGSDEQTFFFLYGAQGANGKSTFVETLIDILGEYARQTPTDTLMVQRGQSGATNDLARLKGVRLIVAPETEDGGRLNEGLIKRLTGGDTVTARFLHQEFFDFRLQGKIWMTGNHKPQIRGTDGAIWRRVALLPFHVVIPVEERDRGLKAKLLAERDGIFSWMIDGYLAWRREGLEKPAAIVEAVDEYRTEQDSMGRFLDENVEYDKNFTVSSSDLYKRYALWSKSNGEYAVSQTRFSKDLKARGILVDKNGAGNMVVRGMALRHDENDGVYRGD